MREHLRAHQAVLGVLMAVVGCTTDAQTLVREVRAPPAPVSGCEATQAELLKSPLTIYAAPDVDSPIVARLLPDQPIYWCEVLGDWFGVWFSDGHADCLTRPADRKCPSGWTNQTPDRSDPTD